jgi:hypothetical protein
MPRTFHPESSDRAKSAALANACRTVTLTEPVNLDEAPVGGYY